MTREYNNSPYKEEYTPEEYVDIFIFEHEFDELFFSVVSRGEYDCADSSNKAYYLLYSTGSSDYGDLKYTYMVVIQGDNNIYELLYQGKVDNYEKFYSGAEKIISTFKVK